MRHLHDALSLSLSASLSLLDFAHSTVLPSSRDRKSRQLDRKQRLELAGSSAASTSLPSLTSDVASPVAVDSASSPTFPSSWSGSYDILSESKNGNSPAVRVPSSLLRTSPNPSPFDFACPTTSLPLGPEVTTFERKQHRELAFSASDVAVRLPSFDDLPSCPIVGSDGSSLVPKHSHDDQTVVLAEGVKKDRSNQILQLTSEVLRMDKQDTLITVHLGRGARIQLMNTVINIGSTGATIQFGSLDFSAITTRTNVPRARLPAPQTTAGDIRQGRTSVFERLSQPETLTAKRVVDGRKISVVTANTTALPRETVTSGIYDAEASSYGGKLNRRQRRKRNAELRTQQLSVPVHPSNIPAEELEANIPTRNKFTDLKW
ncbi:hypothetical protein M5K25_009410 [Dendrobium thyrsiflorum]|uniref:Uncharacterized protein n=1 Tax=Dendrobium thyrsiflorum TaxID=117978 RepID=A0ABD0VCG2_DENTH